MTFEAVARLLAPAQPSEGAIVRADDWRRPGAPPGDVRALVWGREPTAAAARAPLVGYAARRERALAGLRRRPPGGLSVVGVHRWTYRFHRPRVGTAAVWRLREGLIVELARTPRSARVFDDVAAAAGLPAAGALHIGTGGSIVARRGAGPGGAVLRVAVAGSDGDPAHAAGALRRLEPLGLACVPALLGAGTAGGASWTTESLLPGRTPPRLTPELVAAAGELCARLPRGDAPPSAFAEQLGRLSGRLPRFEPALERLGARAAPVLAGVPGVLGHGDLWSENLLMSDGRLTGVVDWDGWHPSAVPGVDLLHLVGIARVFAARRTIAGLVADGAWRDASLARPMAAYWRALDVEPTDALLEVVALAWWAARLDRELARAPRDAEQPDWLRRHVTPVLGP